MVGGLEYLYSLFQLYATNSAVSIVCYEFSGAQLQTRL